MTGHLSAKRSRTVADRMMRLRNTAGLAFVLMAVVACGVPEPKIPGGEPSLRRLTEQQYRNIIADLFGDQIVIAGRFDPIPRQEGLIAVGAANSTISASGFDQYERIGSRVAEQVVDEANRSLYMPCQPADMAGPDPACARAFLEPVGRLLYRRALTAQDLEKSVGLANTASEQLNSFYDGLAFGLTYLLVSPDFLFVIDSVADEPDAHGRGTLTGYAKASRLSFFLWNTTPDEALLSAAESGELNTERGLHAQVERMLRSPKLRQGVASLFTDMLRLDEFDYLEKDAAIYPAFNPKAIEDAREQLVLTIQHHLLDADADYRELFTTRDTFISGPLGRVYRTPVPEPRLWTPYRLTDAESRAGIQSLAGFVAHHSHPGRSSPTIRGQAVRELLMCQQVPAPPGEVDLSVFNEPGSQQLLARDRLDVHNSVPSCAGCHMLTDGIGLGLENYDGAGQFRMRDIGQLIDPSGDLDGVEYADPRGLGAALADNPAVPMCLVQQSLAYGLGRPINQEEYEWFDFLLEKFAEGGYRFKPFLRSIITSDNFFAAASPELLPETESQSAGRL